MRRQFVSSLCSLAAVLLCFVATAPFAWAQHGSTGKVDVTVVDPDGRVVPGAKLELRDPTTNDVRTATTQDGGQYTFVNLNIGSYTLTVTKDGFQTQQYSPVIVSATKTTSVDVSLKLGQATQTVQVEGGATPLIDATTSSVGTTINLKQIEDLPLSGRDLTQLSRLTPGYNGTWNGLPSIAQGNNVDGVIGSPSRMKFGGNAQAAVSPRLEDIEEMTVQTDQLDLNQGFGQAAMQINYVTRRGTNSFHGRLFEDFRNSALNANSWRNNAAVDSTGKWTPVKKPQLKLNDFGGSIGGPIFKDKLFFFGSLATSRRPGTSPTSATYLVPTAQAGTYTYVGTDNATHTVNLFQVAQAYDPTLPGSVNGQIASALSSVNSSLTAGVTTTTSDPIIDSINWNYPTSTTVWYPTIRLDYNMSQKVRMNLAVNRTKTHAQGANAPFFPGSAFATTGAGNSFDDITAAYGLDLTLTPTLINQFKAGYLYNVNRFSNDASKGYFQNPVTVDFAGLVTSPLNWTTPVTSFYPVINASDTANWQHNTHTVAFGFSFYREQDHYWNPPELEHFSLGLVNGDPAINALTNVGTYQPLPAASAAQQAEAQSLYALLVGRVSGVNGSFPVDPATKQYIQKPALAYNLDELSKAWGLFAQDAWHIRPTLTLNYGLRWDFTGAQHDITGAYHNADPSSLYGPSGIGNVFKPGTLTGNANPVLASRPRPYQDWNVSPQPAFGFAWNPQFSGGVLGKMAGHGATVIRGGFSLRKFTVPYQYFWDNASDYGSFFYQFYSLTPNTTGATGTYTPGSLALGNTLPPFAFAPTSYLQTAPESLYTFIGGAPGVNGMKYNIGQPYTESWNFGIQRSLGESRVLEVRYNGNRTLKQWISLNLNEVNIFENGFLQEFQNAQKNLAINGGSSFANLNPAAGTVPVPILTAAFTGSTSGSQTDSQFKNGTFITYLNTGAAGSFANRLSGVGARPYICNLVGSAFTPCATNANYTGAGAGYPINFFQANPYAAGNGVGYMTDAGYSSYNGLQVDFRQRAWHGITVDANYTWSHTLGVSTPNDWTGAYPSFTLRNIHESYGPTLYDLRHVVHVNTTVDLPFGRGKAFLNNNTVMDKIVGGWTIGSIITWQTGYPFRVLSGYNTFNNIADSGVNLVGLSRQQLQDSVGVYRIPGKNFVSIINPAYLKSPTGGANLSMIAPNTTPGTIAPPLYLHGPHGFFDDMSFSKAIPITERWRFNFQAEMLNVFNHPVFGQTTTPIGSNVRSTSWGTVGWNDPRFGGISGFNRQIEFRANLSF